MRPRTAEAVSSLLAWAAARGRRVAVFGAGTNVVGALDGGAEIILSLERMAGVRDLDPVSQLVTVGAGTLGGVLERALGEHGFTLGHYPQSLEISTVGGWVAMRASGTYSTRYGGIEQLLCGLELVLPNGEIARVAPRVRSPGGLDLLALACGSEGTLGVVTEVTLSVQRRLPERILCAVFHSLAAGLELQRELVQGGFRLGLLRLYNVAETAAIAPAELELEACCLVLASLVGPQGPLEAEAETAARLVECCGGRVVPEAAATPWFARRYYAAGLMEEANAPTGRMFDTIEVSLPWRAAAACAEELERELASVSDPFYLHFSHVYTSGVCLYMMLHRLRAGRRRRGCCEHAAWRLALEIVGRHEGAIGHHHGIGFARAAAYRTSPEGRCTRASAGRWTSEVSCSRQSWGRRVSSSEGDALFSVAGRVAVVTGGTTGIGASISRLLVDRGARVAVTHRGSEAARAGLDTLQPEVAVEMTYATCARSGTLSPRSQVASAVSTCWSTAPDQRPAVRRRRGRGDVGHDPRHELEGALLLLAGGGAGHARAAT